MECRIALVNFAPVILALPNLNLMKLNNVTVIGAGTMGNGIAQVFAAKNFNVVLCDISNTALEKALATIESNLQRMLKKELITEGEIKQTLSNITTETDITIAVKSADLVVEAATENIDLKLKIFKQCSILC